ncbi:activin receptor type-2A-like [Amphiura filiformis]|uniref:activin receptor type-2A-like n=1 Tax=Amphiura filiformis TaxID=82378 RepID=UPI003B21E658
MTFALNKRHFADCIHVLFWSTKMMANSTMCCVKLTVVLIVYLSILGLSPTSAASVDLPLEPVYCWEFVQADCDKDPSKCSEELVLCHSEEETVRTCMSLWKTNITTEVLMKGCWPNADEKLCKMDECISRKAKEEETDLFFCCCTGDECNHEFKHIPDNFTEEIPTQRAPGMPATRHNPILVSTVLYSLVPIAGVTILIIILYWMFRKHRRYTSLISIPTTEPSPVDPPTPAVGMRPLQLLEIKARGRFGAVWKAQMLTEYVAVKVFPLQDKHSWITEQEMYSIPQMKHENVLQFIATEKRGEGLDQELWLITEFHPRGSLCDFLKANLITWSELCKIAETMAKGLAFMHEDLPPTTMYAAKPAIAHRDFKSKNVLLKNDLSACIADFGLACKFEAGKSPGDTHGQVGTRRYMAPEVLEGAIQFQRDAFLRIDMYACGLVLWELITRCSAQDGPVDEYMLPFEEEVGLAPSIEEMQDCVVHKRVRPTIREHWLKNAGLEALCETIEECWDHDAAARLSAGCVEERIAQLTRTSNNLTNNTTSNNTNDQSSPPPKESSL